MSEFERHDEMIDDPCVLVDNYNELVAELTRLRAREAVLVDILRLARSELLGFMEMAGFDQSRGDHSPVLTKIDKALATLDVPPEKQ